MNGPTITGGMTVRRARATPWLDLCMLWVMPIPVLLLFAIALGSPPLSLKQTMAAYDGLGGAVIWGLVLKGLLTRRGDG